MFAFDGSSWREITSIPRIWSNCIRGNSSNDLFVVGDFGFVAHFNGMSWRVYSNAALTAGSYSSLDIKGNKMMAVGYIGAGERGVVLRGTR